jgi:hypothetical protein
MTSHYGELHRNQALVRQGLKRARRHHPDARAVLGGGAVSVFYEQLSRSLPKGTIVSVGEGEPLLEKLLLGQPLDGERCFRVGDPPRPGLIHEQPESRPKTACDYSTTSLPSGLSLTGTWKVEIFMLAFKPSVVVLITAVIAFIQLLKVSKSESILSMRL